MLPAGSTAFSGSIKTFFQRVGRKALRHSTLWLQCAFESEYTERKPSSLTDAEAGCEEGERGRLLFYPNGNPWWMITLA